MSISKRDFLVFLFGLIVGFVAGLLVGRYAIDQRDNYCVCSSRAGGRSRTCQPDLARAYDNGMNEYADLSALQKKNGGPQWTTVNPGDYDFPPSQDCDKVNAYLSKVL